MGLLRKAILWFTPQNIEKIEKFAPQKYEKILEAIRLEKWMKESDFSKIDIIKFEYCVIEEGEFPYPLFQMCFFDNMVCNIIYCLSKGYAPIVKFKDPVEKNNLWEQFYCQPYQDEQFNSEQITNVKKCDIKRPEIYMPIWPTRDEITLYARIFKSVAVLNTETKGYITEEQKNILAGKRVIGCLCRGTDYTANKPSGHPIQPEIEAVIKHVKEKMKELNCEYVYLATEEESIKDRFEQAFPRKILTNKRKYYDDFYKLKETGGDGTRISWVHHERKNDNKLKSLEYLSSLYILSNCNALIAGNTGGSRMALYLNDNQYEYWHLFNLGMY